MFNPTEWVIRLQVARDCEMQEMSQNYAYIFIIKRLILASAIFRGFRGSKPFLPSASSDPHRR